VLAEYGLAEEAYELSKRAAELARQTADEFTKPGRPRFVGGSMGPTTKAITVTGGVTFSELRESYYIQAKGLIDGGFGFAAGGDEPGHAEHQSGSAGD